METEAILSYTKDFPSLRELVLVQHLTLIILLVEPKRISIMSSTFVVVSTRLVENRKFWILTYHHPKKDDI